MASALSLNGLRVLSAVLFVPWNGVWYADLDLDPDDLSKVPSSGSATLTIGAAPAPVVTLQGTVDPRYSGTFVAGARVRLVAGGGGWDKLVGPASWNSDGGVVSTIVYQATAGAVGETVNVATPVTLGTSVERVSGPAREVLRDVDWYVDFAGVTQVSARAAATADASLELLDWHPDEQRAELACDTVILPGTTLSDPRLHGATPIIREVEMVFGAKGMRASAWCSSVATNRFSSVLKSLVRTYAGVRYLRVYRYRFVQTSGQRLALQAVTAGAPDINPIAQGTGMSGVLAKLAPGTLLKVMFVNGDPADPFVVGYDPDATPLEVDLAGGADFVGLSAKIDAAVSAIVSAFNAHVHAGGTLGGGLTGPINPVPPTIPIPPQTSTAAQLTKAT